LENDKTNTVNFQSKSNQETETCEEDFILKDVDDLDLRDGENYSGSMRAPDEGSELPMEEWLAHGQGVKVWPNGQRYEGGWKSNAFSGQGKLSHANGDVLEGIFKYGSLNGFGKLTKADNFCQEGNWIDDKLEGEGTETMANGTVYKGEFKDGVKQG